MACGFVVVLFSGYFWPLAFIQAENCSSTLTLFRCNDNSSERWKRSRPAAFTYIHLSRLVVSTAAPSSHFLRGERARFLWPFTSGANTCFLLPVIACLHRKFSINVRKKRGSLAQSVRWWGGGSVRLQLAAVKQVVSSQRLSQTLWESGGVLRWCCCWGLIVTDHF